MGWSDERRGAHERACIRTSPRHHGCRRSGRRARLRRRRRNRAGRRAREAREGAVRARPVQEQRQEGHDLPQGQGDHPGVDQRVAGSQAARRRRRHVPGACRGQGQGGQGSEGSEGTKDESATTRARRPRADPARARARGRTTRATPRTARATARTARATARTARATARSESLVRGGGRRPPPRRTRDYVVRTGSRSPEGTTTHPSNDFSLYGALSGTVVSPSATANAPHGSASLPFRVNQSS